MAWGAGSIAELGGWVPHPTTKVLLGFNEPNLRHQSNLSAQEACSHWPALLKATRRHGLRLGSPAANHCSPTDNCFMSPTDWFDAFFALPGCGVDTVDFIATHKYGSNASDAIEYVRMLSSRYNRPVWLTEFSVEHFARTRARTKVSHLSCIDYRHLLWRK